MGEVKETVKGSGSTKKAPKSVSGPTNLIQDTQALMDEVSKCVQVKDDDTRSEGDLAKAENIRKAAVMRSTYSLLAAVKALLETY